MNKKTDQLDWGTVSLFNANGENMPGGVNLMKLKSNIRKREYETETVYKWALVYMLRGFFLASSKLLVFTFHILCSDNVTENLRSSCRGQSSCLDHYCDHFCWWAPLFEKIYFSCRVVWSKKSCILLSTHDRDLGRAITSLVALEDHNIPHYPLFSSPLPSHPHSLSSLLRFH